MSSFFKRKNKSSHHKRSEDFHLTKLNKTSKNLHLFFSEIMRKLKHSFKKEKPQQHDKRLLMKRKKRFHFQKSLSTKDHFFLERMISRSHQEHYYEILLNNGDFDQYNKRRIVSLLPEYLSPFSSPGRIWGQNSTALSRSPSYDFIKSETVYDDSITIKEIETTSSSESNRNHIIDEISEVEANDGERESELLKKTLPLLSMASTSHYISKTEEYKLVLDPLFIEYEINPTKGETKMQPLCHMDEKESMFNYVKAVMDAMDTNWEDLHLKTEFSDQLLNPALINNIPFYPNQLCLDHELLFDCINEVLFEFCRFPLWVKPKTQVFLFSIESIIPEVQKEVYCRLLPLRIDQSLDRIVIEDIDNSGNWLDTRCDIECIDLEISELILDELLEELMLDL